MGCNPSGPAVTADVIYVGGSIVTLNDAQPNAEVLAIKDGIAVVDLPGEAENDQQKIAA